MKPLIVANLLLLSIALPTWVEASDSSHNHSFKTTYANGSTQEGLLSVGMTKNCVQFSLPPDELDEDYGLEKGPTGNDGMIYCEEPEPSMTSLNHAEKTYQTIDKATMQAMHEQRNQMMRRMGIEPGSGQEKELFKSFGDAMGMVKQKQRESMEKALQDENMSPQERAEAEAYMNKKYPKAQAHGSMEVAAKVTDLNKRDTQNRIPCNWYRVQMSGILNEVRRVCAAAWSDIPGGQRTRELMYAFMDFMKNMSKGTAVKHNIYEVMKEIDEFRVISIKEDGNGNVISEERYLGTKETPISYTPPAEYSMEEMGGMMGNNSHRSRRQITPPPINSTEQPPDTHKDEPVTNSDRPQENPEEMKKKVGELLKGMGLGDLFGK